MWFPALAELQVLLEAEGLQMPESLQADTRSPPPKTLERIEERAEEAALALQAAQQRRLLAEQRVQLLALATEAQLTSLSASSGHSQVELGRLALLELDRALSHERALEELTLKLALKVDAALAERAMSSAAFRARWQQHHRLTPSLGSSAGLGSAVGRSMATVLDQVLDQVLHAEQLHGESLLALKDRLDALHPMCQGLGTLPRIEASARVTSILEEVAEISAAIPRPGRDEGDGQEEHNEAPE